MLLCKDCRFLYDNNYCVRDSVLSYEKTVAALPAVNPVDGNLTEFTQYYALDRSAFERRTNPAACSIVARWFEAKTS